MRGPIELLKESWNMFTAHWKLFLGIFIVPGLISAIFDFLSYKETIIRDENGIVSSVPTFMLENPAAFWGLLAVMIIAILFGSLAMMKAVISSGNVQVSEAYQFGKQYFIPYFVITVMMGVVVMLGLILLVIPGIIFTIWFVFSSYILVSENKKGVEALKASREYVRGHWFEVFGRLLALGAAIVVLSVGTGLVGTLLSSMYIPEAASAALVSFVISAIAMPVITAYYYFIYQDLRKLKGAVSAVTETSVVNEATL